MKVLYVLSVFLYAAVAAEEYCYQSVVSACTSTKKDSSAHTLNCTSKYGAIDEVENYLQKYVNHHFVRSFEYLLMSTHFANYEKNRPGFEKLFRGLSDNKWHEAIELIQYITKRGGEMNFNAMSQKVSEEAEHTQSYELYELAAVAKALDIEKKMALEAHEIHGEATRRNKNFHDPEISSHIENEFVHKQRDIIRKLAGYAADLNGLLNGSDSSLSLYLFDDYLMKE